MMRLSGGPAIRMNISTVKVIVLFAAVLTLVGCSTPPAAPEPPVALPERFSVDGETVLPEKWWESFGDEALNATVEKALEGNFTLKSARERLAQAEASARKAGAGVFPEVSLSASWSRSKERANDMTDFRGSYRVGVGASYEVDLWGRVRATRDAAAIDALSSRENARAAAVTVSATTARTWYQLAEAASQIDVLNEQTATNESVLELVTLQFRRGQAKAADVLRQRQLVESVRGNLILAKVRHETLNYSLAVLLGSEPRTAFDTESAALIEVPPLPSAGVPSEVIERRPDVRSAYASVLAADRRIAVAIADRFPRLGLSADVATSGPQASDLFENWISSIAANLLQPVFDANRRSAEVDRTRAAARQALDDYAQVVLEALREVEDALAREKSQAEYVVSIETQLETARGVTDRIRDSYFQGQIDYIRVLEALVSRQNLERQRLTALRTLIEYRIDLCRAIAGGWELEDAPKETEPADVTAPQEETLETLQVTR